jgi:PqqA peptide cyclase
VTDHAAILPEPPMGLLAELTHRCPLQCPYCANPLELERAGAELDTATWLRVLEQAAALGILQVHFSGGEPTARKDLVVLVRRAAELQLYSNLITSGVLLDSALVTGLVQAGLDHVQLSFQDTDPGAADRLGGLRGGHAGKLRAAALVRGAGLPLTLNFVVHRQNLAHVPAMIALAETVGAGRIEIAHVQYYGWGLVNRAALLPTRAQVDAATDAVEAARERLKGRIMIDYVPPDYHAERPKACMGGWARRLMNITPAGRVLPCHAAETLPGFDFPSVRDSTLAEIWRESTLFRRFRGTGWMPEPCRSCDRREIDWGGCRCQAFALTGDAANTDPVCTLAPTHGLVAAALRESEGTASELVYRRIGAASHTVTAAPVTAK